MSWKVYQNLPDNFTDNPLAGFRQFRKAYELAGNDPNVDPNPPAWTPASEAANPLYKGTANTMPDGGFLQALRDDVANGALPQVSWIVAPAAYSEHPGPSSPVQGAWYIQETLNALTANPDVWSKTVLLVNFDENDGFFDHVPSPAAPSLNPDGSMAGASTINTDLERHVKPSLQDAADNRVYGPGPRVPMYVVSPWSRGGWVNSQAFDHTSVLRFLEARFGVAEKNISAYRRAVLGDLTSAFNFATPNNEQLPDLTLLTKAQADQTRADQQALAQVPLPDTSTQVKPKQETGVRYSRALPYELHTSARCAAAGTVELVFANTGTQGAVFHVYDRYHLDRLPRRYAVEAGKTLSDTWNALLDSLGRYDLWVLGPNGYHRHFKGDIHRIAASGSLPEVRVCYDIANGEVYAEFLNTGANACTFTVTPQAYRQDAPLALEVAGGSKATRNWNLAASGQWYDFAVTCSSDPAFYRRFAGRVETGAHTVSDPAMGVAGA